MPCHQLRNNEGENGGVRFKALNGLLVVLIIAACGAGERDEEIRKLEDRLGKLEMQTATSTVDSAATETFRQAQTDRELHFRCEPDLPDSKGDGCGSPTLVEYWASRGIRVLAPTDWHDSLRDGMGSGSSAKWWNPEDPEEHIEAHTGVSKGMWYEIDEVEGSISPGLMISETADIYPQSRTVFVYVDSEGDYAILGVWRVTQSNDGDDCCYYDAQIRLRYDNGRNAHFWNMFLGHQLRVVAETDFYVDFQHHMLADRFS